MIELRFHGRGGQGAVIASELLAQAAFLEGKFPQSFPFFGVERRGAPVTAYTRIDVKPIGVRTSVTEPDIVVVLDAGLMRSIRVAAGLKRRGLLLVNTDGVVSGLDAKVAARIATVDATAIALAQGLGSRSTPIVNTAVLGALARASEIVSLDSVLQAIERFVPAKQEANMEAARLAYREVKVPEVVAA
ncbi:MAG: pyruvate ferredoxin oxidoreductase [Euryarchaeota archaeon RBG_19FT_COMBO_69_17]|nr:MAG: pyruvate ferredoxin oxidoreductase [Euryarchaeota archaeon RBG_19FT_COMBO_69_17]